MSFGHFIGMLQIPFENKFDILECAMNRQGKTHGAFVESAVGKQGFLEGHSEKQKQRRSVKDSVKDWWTTSMQSDWWTFGSGKLVVDHTDDGKDQMMANQDNDPLVRYQKPFFTKKNMSQLPY